MCTVHIRFPWPETERRKRISSSAPTGVNAKSFPKGSVGQRAQGKSKRAGVLKPENKLSGGEELMNGKPVFSENELRESRHGEVTHRCSASRRPARSRQSSVSTRPAAHPALAPPPSSSFGMTATSSRLPHSTHAEPGAARSSEKPGPGTGSARQRAMKAWVFPDLSAPGGTTEE